jgi:hypothetical protein
MSDSQYTAQQIEQLRQELTSQNAISQVNTMITNSAASLTCGPDCQKVRYSEELRQKFLDAQANVNAAPAKLDTAAKEYYTYTQGVAGYNRYLSGQVSSEAKDITTTATSTFSSASDKLLALTKTYNELNSTYINTIDLYKKYLIDNSILEGRINGISTDTVTSDRKSFYEGQGVDNLNNWYILLKWIYIILLIVYVFGMILVGSNYSFLTRFFILIAFIIYPFVIVFVVSLLYGGLLRFLSLFPKNAYTTME